MDPLLFRVIHLVGVMLLFLAMGGLAYSAPGSKAEKGIAALHGIGLLIVIIAGFGMQGMMKLGFPLWMILKIVIWVALGVSLVLAKRGKLKGAGLIWFSLILGAAAAYMGVFKIPA